MSLMGDEVAAGIHPGKAVREDCLKAEGLTVSAAAEKLGVARTTPDRVLNGRGGISADMIPASQVSLAKRRRREVFLCFVQVIKNQSGLISNLSSCSS